MEGYAGILGLGFRDFSEIQSFGLVVQSLGQKMCVYIYAYIHVFRA